MSYRTMTIAISDEEMQALTRLALTEYRRPRDQARYMLKAALEAAKKNEGNGSRPSEPVALGSNA